MVSEQSSRHARGLFTTSAALTDDGCVRDHNEDAILARPDLGLWVVADGMGGHSAGDVASTMIVEQLATMQPQVHLADTCDEAERILNMVNQELRRRSNGEQHRMMGSTVIFYAIGDGTAACGWAGDSRAYRWRRGKFTQISRDHSHVEELVARGELTPEQAENHPQANIVTRAVGGEARLLVDFVLLDIEAGDRLLLCSDGLTKELSDRAIADMLGAGQPPAVTVETMLEAALDSGGHDNVSIVVIDVQTEPGAR